MGLAHDHTHDYARTARWAIWWALFINATMFAVEIGSSMIAGSVALLADSLDFFADAATYAITLAVMGLSLRARAAAALAKAAMMAAVGMAALGTALHNFVTGAEPDAIMIGTVGAAALAANAASAGLLIRFRKGESNLRALWLCSRNDALGNLAVIAAGAGVYGTGAAWPDIAVGALLACLGLSAALGIARQALAERAGHRCA